MSKFQSWIAIVLILSASAAHAGDLVRCPAIGEEYEEMLGKLEAIKAAVKGEACSQVTLNIDKLEYLVANDREAVLEIVKNAGDQPLNAQAAAKIREYTENVTKRVATLYDLFTGANQCFADEDGADKALTGFAGFIGEASQLLASVSGPYGAPISMAGNVVAGFLTGLDKVLKSRVGYRFEKPAQWAGYVRNVCNYFDLAEQMEHLLDPAKKIAELRSLESKLSILSNMGGGDAAIGLRGWVQDEIGRVERESRTPWGNSSGRHMLYRAKHDIEDFLLAREAPRFLAYQTGRGREDYNIFLGFGLSEGRRLYDEIERSFPTILAGPAPRGYFTNPQEYLRVLLFDPPRFDSVRTSPELQDLRDGWAYFQSRSLEYFDTARNTLEVQQNFCGFFKLVGQYSASIRAECTSQEFRNLLGAEEEMQGLLRVPANPVIDPAAPHSLTRLEELTKSVDAQLARIAVH